MRCPLGFQAFVMRVSQETLSGYIKHQDRVWLRWCLNKVLLNVCLRPQRSRVDPGFWQVGTQGGLIYIPREQEADRTLQQHFTHKYHLLNDGARYKSTHKIYSMVKAGKCQIEASVKTSITSLT